MSFRKLAKGLIFRSDKDFWKAVVLGALTGSVTMVLAKGGLTASGPWWELPLVALIFAMFAIPFVAFGLAVFGLPATALLLSHADRWWSGVVALLVGAFAGELMYLLLDRLLFDGTSMFGPRPGAMFGVPTALIWWWLLRKARASV